MLGYFNVRGYSACLAVNKAMLTTPDIVVYVA